MGLTHRLLTARSLRGLRGAETADSAARNTGPGAVGLAVLQLQRRATASDSSAQSSAASLRGQPSLGTPDAGASFSRPHRRQLPGRMFSEEVRACG